MLGPLLRYADDTSATVWIETSGPACVEVLGQRTGTFSVGGRHYGLVMIEGLQPGICIEYTVKLDGAEVWPEPDTGLPPSVIRTKAKGQPVSMLLGSCRAAAPHEPPYSLERTLDHEGRGIDALWAHALLIKDEPVDHWPDLLVFVGDQVYADDSSPRAKERIETVRPDDSDLPPELVAGFEEYCWLYAESWSSPVERWLLSTVPSAMIFDDHDMIDDWNISAAWVSDIRREPWWNEHVVGGLMSYWIYQHLGNQSPAQIRHEGLLERLLAVDDGTDLLRHWAFGSEEFTPLPGGYRFSYARSVGDMTLLMIDCRNSRVLEPNVRLMVGDDEWSWIAEQATAATGHLVLAASVPVFIADGLHDLQTWNEAVCDGAWGRLAGRWGERVRRYLDLEDWSAFEASYSRFTDLVDALRVGGRLDSIVVASGDIHFSYAARVPGRGAQDSVNVWQVVSSPIRNALNPHERWVMRFCQSSMGRAIGAGLRRSVRRPPTRPGMSVVAGPFFANNMCQLCYDGPDAELIIEHFTPDGDGMPVLQELARIDLG